MPIRSASCILSLIIPNIYMLVTSQRALSPCSFSFCFAQGVLDNPLVVFNTANMGVLHYLALVQVAVNLIGGPVAWMGMIKKATRGKKKKTNTE